MAKGQVYVMRGIADWAKVIGPPRLNTFTEEREWSIDVTPYDKKALATVKEAGIVDRLRDPKEDDHRKDRFLKFKQREFRTDAKTGERIANEPIRISAGNGDPWPEGKLIGNGSIIDLKFIVRDNGKGRPKGVYPQAIRVLKHVPYEVSDFDPVDENDEFYAETEAPAGSAATPDFEKDFGLDADTDNLDDEVF